MYWAFRLLLLLSTATLLLWAGEDSSAGLRVDGGRLLAFEKSPNEVIPDFGQSEPLAQAASNQDAVDKGADDKSDPTVTGKDKKLDERLGEAPDEDYREVFLREESVLLARLQIQLEFALGYTPYTFTNVRGREGSLFSTVRLGLPYNLEASISVPFNVRDEENFRRSDTGEITVIDDDETGIGDIQASLNAILLQETETWPSIYGSLSLVEPTGEDPSITNRLFGLRTIALFTSRRSGTAGLTFVKSTDPAVLFGGLTFTYVDTDSVGGIEIEGGHALGYSFGTGFALNDELTLSGSFSGSYQTEIELDGQPATFGAEPWFFSTGLTYALSATQYIEPGVSFGLNPDAGENASVGLAYLISF